MHYQGMRHSSRRAYSYTDPGSYLAHVGKKLAIELQLLS
jgi:hypothetical protein